MHLRSTCPIEPNQRAEGTSGIRRAAARLPEVVMSQTSPRPPASNYIIAFRPRPRPRPPDYGYHSPLGRQKLFKLTWMVLMLNRNIHVNSM